KGEAAAREFHCNALDIDCNLWQVDNSATPGWLVGSFTLDTPQINFQPRVRCLCLDPQPRNTHVRPINQHRAFLFLFYLWRGCSGTGDLIDMLFRSDPLALDILYDINNLWLVKSIKKGLHGGNFKFNSFDRDEGFDETL